MGKDRALHHWSCSEPCEFCVACRGSGSCARHETMECPHEGCSQSFRSKALFDAHVAICEHFRRPCPNVCSGCPMRAMPKGEYEAHSRVCGFRLINCPNASCEVRLLASDLAHHRATTCLYEEVRCPNKGCNSMLERGELDRHSQQTCVHRVVVCRAPGCGAKLTWLKFQVSEWTRARWAVVEKGNRPELVPEAS